MEKKMFQKLVKLLEEFANDGFNPKTLTFNGPHFEGMNPSHTTLLKVDLPMVKERRVQGTYEIELPDLQELTKKDFNFIALHRVHRGKMIFKTDTGRGHLSIPVKRSTNEKDGNSVTRTLKKFHCDLEVTDPSELKKALEVIGAIKARAMETTADRKSQRLIIRAEGEVEEFYEKRLQVGGMMKKRMSKAYYAHDLMALILPFLDDCWKCKVAFATEYPMRITLEFLDGVSDVNLYLAPRIEAAD